MSTTGVTSWAVDLADVGAIYPFQGEEILMLLVGPAFWIWRHVWSVKNQRAVHEKKIRDHGSADSLKKALDLH